MARAEDYLRRLVEDRRFIEMRVWHGFHSFLESLKLDEPVPAPLILAANGASPQSKLERLGEQLRWAERNNVFAEAAAYLDGLPAEQWSRCGDHHWPRIGDV